MITLISSFAKDILLDEQERITAITPGGPAFFIQQVFKEHNVLFHTITGPEIEVQILQKAGKELGRILNPPEPLVIDHEKINSDYVLISGIANEFDLINLPKYNGKIFFDIQGQVRNPKDFGKKQIWEPSLDIQDAFYCIKGTKEEVAFLPIGFFEQQKNKLLIITNGIEDITIYEHGQRITVTPPRANNPLDTIGAGDTFFANFTMDLIDSKNAVQSVEYAANKTKIFLENKTRS